MKAMTYVGAAILLTTLAAAPTPPHATAAAPEPVTIDQLEINRDELAQDKLALQGPPSELAPRETLFGQRIAQILADEERQIAAALAQKTASASLAQQERRIARIKQDTELALLRLQIDRAHILGDESTAKRLETAIEEILNPRIETVQVERPTPQQPR